MEKLRYSMYQGSTSDNTVLSAWLVTMHWYVLVGGRWWMSSLWNVVRLRLG